MPSLCKLAFGVAILWMSFCVSAQNAQNVFFKAFELMEKDPETAIVLFRSGLASSPNSGLALYHLARLLDKKGGAERAESLAYYKRAAQLLTKEVEGAEALARSIQLERSALQTQKYVGLLARLQGKRYAVTHSRQVSSNPLCFTDKFFEITFSDFDITRQKISGTARLSIERFDISRGTCKIDGGTTEFNLVGGLQEDLSNAAILRVQLELVTCPGHYQPYCDGVKDDVRSPISLVLYEAPSKVTIVAGEPGLFRFGFRSSDEKDFDLTLSSR